MNERNEDDMNDPIDATTLKGASKLLSALASDPAKLRQMAERIAAKHGAPNYPKTA
jgi:hypothetical protein